MEWVSILAVFAAILGTSGVAGVIVAWRKSVPEADSIIAGTQEKIFTMANQMIDNVNKRLLEVEDHATLRVGEAEARSDRLIAQAEERSAVKIANHERRIRDLEKRLRDAGLPWNGT